MGVGFYCNGERFAGCAYSTFNDFRRNIAAEVGIDLDRMEGFCDDGISWKDAEGEPLVPFLNHSDCDGELSPEDCAAVGPRLAEVMVKLEGEIKVEMDQQWQEKGYPATMQFEHPFVTLGRGLVEGMKRAVETGKPLEFT